MMPSSGEKQLAKFMLLGPNGELHEARIRLPNIEELKPGHEVEAEDVALGFKVYFLVRCVEHPEPDDPRYREAETWVYLEMAR